MERGGGYASDDLIRRIAAATYTTYEWLMGTSGHQSAYPESDGSQEQMHDNSAGLGYLVDLIRTACLEKDWGIKEPEQQSAFSKTAWMPDCWFYVQKEDVSISYWAFDLSLCIYKHPNLFSKDGSLSPKIAFFNFLSNLVFGNPLIRSKTKYTFAVPSGEIFDSLLKQPTLPLGKVLVADLKAVYAAVDAPAALEALELFVQRWEKKCSKISASWQENWPNLSTYFKFPQEVRRLIRTTNAIEGFHRQLRKATKAKFVFPTDDSLFKMLYLAMMDITKKWMGRRQDWSVIHAQLAVYFADRMLD